MLVIKSLFQKFFGKKDLFLNLRYSKLKSILTVAITVCSTLVASPTYAADTITLPSSFVGDNTGFQNIYTVGDQPISVDDTTHTFRITFSVSSGNIQITKTTGLTAVTGYPLADWTSGTATEIAFTGSYTDVSNAAASLQYKGTEGVLTASILDITSGGDASYYDSTGSYYQYVSTSLTWDDARAAAAASTLNGMTGYLATVTSAGEFDFIKAKAGASQIWLGGTDAAVEGEWRWIDDPGVPVDEAGVQFWQGDSNG